MDADGGAQVEALKALYAQKTKSLLHTISTLEAEVKRLKSASKEHKRSALISGLQEMVKERDTVVEVLKNSLTVATGHSREQIDTFILKKTTGMPAKIRPQTREELATEIATLKKKLDSANITIRKLEMSNIASRKAGGDVLPALFPDITNNNNISNHAESARRPTSSGAESYMIGGSDASKPPSTSGAVAGSALAAARAAGKDSRLHSEINELREQLAALEAINAEQCSEIEELHSHLKGLLAIEGQAEECHQAVMAAEGRIKQLEKQLTDTQNAHVNALSKLEDQDTEIAVLRRQVLAGSTPAEAGMVAAKAPLPSLGPSASRQQLDSVISILQTENSALQAQVASLQKKAQQDELVLVELQTGFNKASNDLAKEREQKKALQSSLAHADSKMREQELKISTLDAELLRKQAELETSMQALGTARGGADRAADMEQLLRAASEAAVADKEKEIAALHTQLDALKADVKHEHHKRTALEKEREDLRKRLQQEEMYQEEARNRSDADLSTALEACQAAESKASALQAELDVLRAAPPPTASTEQLELIGALQSDVGKLKAERNSYADLARKAATRAGSLQERLVAEQGRTAELLKRVTQVLKAPESGAATSAMTNMCLQAIGVCESRVLNMASELSRLRNEEQSNEITVTTCHATIEALDAYAKSLAWKLTELGTTVPAPPLDVVETAEKLVEELEKNLSIAAEASDSISAAAVPHGTSPRLQETASVSPGPVSPVFTSTAPVVTPSSVPAASSPMPTAHVGSVSTPRASSAPASHTAVPAEDPESMANPAAQERGGAEGRGEEGIGEESIAEEIEEDFEVDSDVDAAMVTSTDLSGLRR